MNNLFSRWVSNLHLVPGRSGCWKLLTGWTQPPASAAAVVTTIAAVERVVVGQTATCQGGVCKQPQAKWLQSEQGCVAQLLLIPLLTRVMPTTSSCMFDTPGLADLTLVEVKLRVWEITVGILICMLPPCPIHYTPFIQTSWHSPYPEQILML